MTIEDVIKKHVDQLMNLPNVTGVGIGEEDGKEVIKIFVKRKVPEASLMPEEIVSKTLDGYKTDVEESGIFTAQT